MKIRADPVTYTAKIYIHHKDKPKSTNNKAPGEERKQIRPKNYRKSFQSNRHITKKNKRKKHNEQICPI